MKNIQEAFSKISIETSHNKYNTIIEEVTKDCIIEAVWKVIVLRPWDKKCHEPPLTNDYIYTKVTDAIVGNSEITNTLKQINLFDTIFPDSELYDYFILTIDNAISKTVISKINNEFKQNKVMYRLKNCFENEILIEPQVEKKVTPPPTPKKKPAQTTSAKQKK